MTDPQPLGFFATLAAHPALFIGCCVVLGLLVGSFLNVVIYRVPIMMDNDLRAECAALNADEPPEDPQPCAAPEPGTPEVAVSEPTPPEVVELGGEVAATQDVSASPEPSADVASHVDATPDAGATPGADSVPDAAPVTNTPQPFNLIVPRSACPACKTPIPAQENIPVVSWLMLRGRCSSCGARISARYPLVEAATGVLSGFIAWHFGFGVMAVAALVFTWFLIALTMIDFDTQFLPDQLTYPLLWLGLLFSLFHPVWAPGADPLTPRDSIIGAAVGYLSLWSVYWLFKWLTGKEGMGYGDFKLFAALGAWLGWQMLLPLLIFASGVGAVVGIYVMIRQHKGRDMQIAFGPFLAVAGWLAMLYGHRAIGAYLDIVAGG